MWIVDCLFVLNMLRDKYFEDILSLSPSTLILCVCVCVCVCVCA
jgi:hypothetical protein